MESGAIDAKHQALIAPDPDAQVLAPSRVRLDGLTVVMEPGDLLEFVASVFKLVMDPANALSAISASTPLEKTPSREEDALAC